MDNTSSMYLYVKLNLDANRFLPAESKYCTNSASYKYINMSASRGAHFVPMGMPTICWKNFQAKTTKILSARNSSILMMSSSMKLLFESEWSFTKLYSIFTSLWRFHLKAHVECPDLLLIATSQPTFQYAF